jgi:hypothetical protein
MNSMNSINSINSINSMNALVWCDGIRDGLIEIEGG